MEIINSKKQLVAAALAFALLSTSAWAQQGESGASYRKVNVHNANQVRTVFGNWGVIGQPCSGGPRGAWRYDNDGYLGDVSPLVGAEVTSQGKTFHCVEGSPVDRPTTATDTDPRSGKYWTFEPVNGYSNPNGQVVAMSTDPTSWPPFWPDKVNDPLDPGWRGEWNGYFGKNVMNADQESYFVMDDNNNERFNDSVNNAFHVSFKPDSTNPSRNGLGLIMSVRGLQWAQFLAKDNIFWLYEIDNTGTTNYTKVVFGLLVGTYVGVTGCNDQPMEYDNDWSFYDIQNNLTYTGNYPPTQMKNPLWIGNVGLVGYAFLESPGNPYDGIDNDGDADSSITGKGAPQFQESDFTDSTLVAPGTKLVLIDTNFVRSVYVIPDVKGGVFLSVNNGTSWQAASSGLTGASISCLTVSGSDIFAGTDGDGVFLSIDNGRSWQAMNTGLTNHSVRSLVVDSTNVFAGTYGGGVFLSTDGGTSWQAVDSGLTNRFVLSLVATGSNLFAATRDSGIFVSTNNGTRWHAANTGLTNSSVRSLVVSDSNILAGTWGNGVFLSTNNGGSWRAVSTGLTNSYVVSLVASHSNIFAGTWGGGVFLSTDNGASWQATNAGLTNGYIVSLAVSGSDVFAGSNGSGIYLSTDNGAAWQATGLTVYSVSSLAISDSNILAGTADSMVVHTRGLYRWLRPNAKTPQYIKPEGNVLYDASNNPYVNPNAYDGVDNNFNGLIDENYYLHYHQIKKTHAVPPVVLLDILRPVRHINYLTGAGNNPYSMIDEKRDDQIDNNLNWNIKFDDVGIDGVPNTGDYGEGDGLPTSGYARPLLNEPGEPHIDKTDVDESDQIGLTSFYYFTPANNLSLADKEGLWKDVAPGYFDVPTSIVNNRPQAGEDGDFMYSSGYFPLLAGKTERFSLALVYGGTTDDIDANLSDLLKHKKTVQNIYNANYQFPKPPDKPTVTAVAGDGQVTLYWDRKAEQTIDPVLHTKTFEGYKIYRSTQSTFSDIFTITDASGDPVGYKPLAQFDLKDGITGYFVSPPDLYQENAAYSYYLGNDTGIVHTYVDKNVENGRRYFYAVVAYSRGDDTLGIFPAENDKFVTINSSGVITHGINVAVVTPSAPVAGYVPAPNSIPLTHIVRYGTGEVYYNVVDPTKITGHTYGVDFFDAEIDSLDQAGNPVVNKTDSTTWTRLTTLYSVRDTTTISEGFASLDTTLVYLSHQNLIASTVLVTDNKGKVVSPSKYKIDVTRGTIKSATPGSLPVGNYRVSYQYYPVYRSANILGSPFVSEAKDADIFDGLELSFNNNWNIGMVDSLSGWIGPNAYVVNFFPLSVKTPPAQGYARPADYDICFSDSVIDTSAGPGWGVPSFPVNFKIFNRTEDLAVKFLFSNTHGNNRISPTDGIILLEKSPRGDYTFTWKIYFANKVSDKSDSVYNLKTGDTLRIKTSKPFRYGDLMQFTPVFAQVSHGVAAHDLSRIKVVPNPYVSASTHELPLPPGITSGRGDRRIEFIHVPAGAKIRIFTSRGILVNTLYQDGNIEDGTVVWNLKSNENLDIAFGVYFYVVESSVGTKTGKIAIIK